MSEPIISGELVDQHDGSGSCEVLIRVDGLIAARQIVVDQIEGAVVLRNLLSAVKLAFGADSEHLDRFPPERDRGIAARSGHETTEAG